MGARLVQQAAVREGDEAMVMDCKNVWREISNYVDGEVDGAMRLAMEEHFKTCVRCASVLAGTRNVVALYGDERMLEVPAGFSGRLEKRLAKNAVVKGSGWSSWSAWLVPVAAVALIAVGLGVVNKVSFKPPAKSILAAPPRDIPPDMLVVVSDGSKVFHVAGCPFIHDKATERDITAKEAMRDGYVPCSRCMRQYLKTSLTGPFGSDGEDGDEQEAVVSVAGH
jgi:hypothetical protein